MFRLLLAALVAMLVASPANAVTREVNLDINADGSIDGGGFYTFLTASPTVVRQLFLGFPPPPVVNGLDWAFHYAPTHLPPNNQGSMALDLAGLDLVGEITRLMPDGWLYTLALRSDHTFSIDNTQSTWTGTYATIIPPVPLPAGALTLASALVGLAYLGRLRARRFRTSAS